MLVMFSCLASAQSLPPPSMAAESPMPAGFTKKSSTQVAVMSTAAMEVLTDVHVTQIGTYQDDPQHFVWFTKLGEQCASDVLPTHRFSDNQGSGAALHATLMTALVNQRKLDVRVDGCQVFEVYLR
jgi:hypothetical protein